MIGSVLNQVKDELITSYTACGIMLGFSGILMYYIERNAQPPSFRKHRRWILVGYRCLYYRGLWRHLSSYSTGTVTQQYHQSYWYRYDCYPYRYHQFRLHEYVTGEKEQRKEWINSTGVVL